MAKLKAEPVIGTTKSGRRLTEADALAMAEAFEKDDSDPGTWERRYVGRPPLSPRPAGTHSPRVSVRLPEASYELLKARALREDRRVSDVAREAIEAYVALPFRQQTSAMGKAALPIDDIAGVLEELDGPAVRPTS